METNSVITSPSGMMEIRPGYNRITGFAWSGHGKIAKVEVSTDDDKTWKEAQLTGPVLPRAQARFQMDWDWDGQPTRIVSRSTDDHWNVQPDRKTFIDQMGTNALVQPKTFPPRQSGETSRPERPSVRSSIPALLICGCFGSLSRGGESAMKSPCCIGQCFAMCDVLRRHGSNGGRKVAKDFREQFVIDMHMDGLPSVDIPNPLEHEGNASRVEVGVETRGSLERTNIELIGVFEGNLRFVRYRLCHLVGSLLKTVWSTSWCGLLQPSTCSTARS